MKARTAIVTALALVAVAVAAPAAQANIPWDGAPFGPVKPQACPARHVQAAVKAPPSKCKPRPVHTPVRQS